jgi:predicted Fe-S protein YdhL (DUF1289 family)
MEPLNPRLIETLRQRWKSMDDDERTATVMYLAGASPSRVVRAMNYAQRLAEEVDETLRLS